MRGLRRRDFVIVGFVSLLIGLVATLPAALVLKVAGVDSSSDTVGALWKGETRIGEATAASWRIRPLRSILGLGVATDIVVRGGDTDIVARGMWRPGVFTLEAVSGVAGPALVNTMIADLPITCDVSFIVELDRVVLVGRRPGAQGRVRSAPARCFAKGGLDATPAAIPAIIGRSIMTADGASAWLAPASAPDGPRLVQMTIDRSGKLTVTVLDAGALILPATAGRMAIETQL